MADRLLFESGLNRFWEKALSKLNGMFVLKTTTINGKALSSNVTLSASDVGAIATGSTVSSATSATKLATARTLMTSLSSGSTASFDGTADVTIGTTGVLPVSKGGTGSSSEKYLQLTGGTITGDLRLKGDTNYGTTIRLGDGDYVHLSEPTDDCLEVKAKKINFVVSATTDDKFTLNGEAIGGSSTATTAESATKLATARTFRTNLASTSTASFDGTANVTPGVTGTLPIANGGTGSTTKSAAQTALGIIPNTTVSTITSTTQSAYDSLSTKNSKTLYLITG